MEAEEQNSSVQAWPLSCFVDHLIKAEEKFPFFQNVRLWVPTFFLPAFGSPAMTTIRVRHCGQGAEGTPIGAPAERDHCHPPGTIV